MKQFPPTTQELEDELWQNKLAFKKLKESLEYYEKTLDADCECHLANPGGFCPRCGLVEKARRIATKIIGDYEQQ